MGTRIACLGDSLTNGSYLEKCLPNRLSEAYPRMDVVNLGISGETTAQILARVSGVVAYAPSRVIVWAGMNDVGTSVVAATIESNLQSIFTYCAGFAEVLALTITPGDLHTSEMNIVRNAVNAWIKNTATGVSRVIDAWTIVSDPASPGNRLPAYADESTQGHINDAGIAAIVSEILG